MWELVGILVCLLTWYLCSKNPKVKNPAAMAFLATCGVAVLTGIGGGPGGVAQACGGLALPLAISGSVGLFRFLQANLRLGPPKAAPSNLDGVAAMQPENPKPSGEASPDSIGAPHDVVAKSGGEQIENAPAAIPRPKQVSPAGELWRRRVLLLGGIVLTLLILYPPVIREDPPSAIELEIYGDNPYLADHLRTKVIHERQWLTSINGRIDSGRLLGELLAVGLLTGIGWLYFASDRHAVSS